MVHIELLYIDK